MRLTVEEKFWRSTLVKDGCWEWTGAKAAGYGCIRIPGGGMEKAHRVSAMLHFGMFDRRLCVCHHCDNPGCVNPEHLYIGTHADNAADRVRRGRSRNQWSGMCKRGHQMEGNRTSRGDCLTCERDRGRRQSRAIGDAARVLGLTQAAYIERHGRSRTRAESIAKDPECALLAVTKFIQAQERGLEA